VHGVSTAAGSLTTVGPGPVRAARLRRPSWRDPRLAVGAVLVLASVALGVGVVTAADDTVPVYAAGRTLAPGTPLSEADLRVVRVRLDGTLDRYLPADGDGPAPGAVTVRTVGAGEIVPRSAVGRADLLDVRPVTVPVDGPLPPGLGPGALVDVWIVALAPGDRPPSDPPPAPEKALAGVEVSGVDTADGGLAPAAGASVAVLLDDDGTTRVLGALARGHRVDLVPLPGSVPGR